MRHTRIAWSTAIQRATARCAVFSLSMLGATALLTSAPAWSQDKIDGEWCRENRSFKVERENVTTYFGSKVTGDYDDGLGVRYISPANEPEAGLEIIAVLRSRDMVYLFRRQKGTSSYGEREAWQRCKVTS